MRLVRLKPQGPGPDKGPYPRYNENLQSRTTLWAPKFLEKICGRLKLLPSGISIRPAVLLQFTPLLTNQLNTNNKQLSIA